VRWASHGRRALENTHPFSRTFRSRDVILAHNGTVDPVVARAALKFRTVGDADSEYLFCALITRLSEQRIRFTDHAQIEAVLREFNAFGHMNLLFSDSEHLFGYHDQDGYTGLCMTRRTAPFDRVSLRDEDWQVDLAEEKRPDQRGYVIATRRLTDDENWTGISPGERHPPRPIVILVRHHSRRQV